MSITPKKCKTIVGKLASAFDNEEYKHVPNMTRDAYYLQLLQSLSKTRADLAIKDENKRLQTIRLSEMPSPIVLQK